MKSAIDKCDKQLCPREIPGELGPILLHPKKGNNIHSQIMFSSEQSNSEIYIDYKNVRHTFRWRISSSNQDN